jgi:preprotein translocase subunit SecF
VKYDKPAEPDRIRDALISAGFVDIQVLPFGSSRDVLIRLPLKTVAPVEGSKAELGVTSGATAAKTQNEAMQKQNDAVMAALKAQDASANLTRTEVVGGVVGKELATDGALALLFVCLGIMAYLAIRFEWRFAVATIIANLHDVVIILGFFAAFQWEFSLPVLAAVLAILGYSVNESVVVFDRARENFRKMRKATTEEIFDAAITGTISRTIITHTTTEMMVIAMLFLGGPTLFYFALALTIGILFGIYSSVLVACPLAKYLGVSREDFVKVEKKKENEPEVISAAP